ncbi:MAG: histidine kinase, partial [Lachnospiraceae bacterium]|nr:histidine kinase [Lachnospiraceae bacterium]
QLTDLHLGPYTGVALLAQYLRTVLDQFNRVVTLTEEFESIQTYVEIQKLRFGDHILFESELDMDLEWFKVPAMTIQPLVENAFQHGVRNEKRGYIRCVAEKDGEDVLLYVWDDGVGLTEEKRTQLLQSLSEGDMNENPEKNIGLSNVWRRLNLYYPGRVTPFIRGAENEYSQMGFRLHEADQTDQTHPDT